MTAKRKRPCVVAVQLDAQEKREIQVAAKRAGLAMRQCISEPWPWSAIRRGDSVRVEPAT